jgi:hypothetical protein
MVIDRPSELMNVLCLYGNGDRHWPQPAKQQPTKQQPTKTEVPIQRCFPHIDSTAARSRPPLNTYECLAPRVVSAVGIKARLHRLWKKLGFV